MQEKIATSFIEAFRLQPLALALIVMNIGLLGFLYYEGIKHAEERRKELELLYANRREVALLLHSCYPTAPYQEIVPKE